MFLTDTRSVRGANSDYGMNGSMREAFRSRSEQRLSRACLQPGQIEAVVQSAGDQVDDAVRALRGGEVAGVFGEGRRGREPAGVRAAVEFACAGSQQLADRPGLRLRRTRGPRTCRSR